jgi:hypothetical protein
VIFYYEYFILQRIAFKKEKKNSDTNTNFSLLQLINLNKISLMQIRNLNKPLVHGKGKQACRLLSNYLLDTRRSHKKFLK